MLYEHSAPFPRGQTHQNGITIDSNNLPGVNLEGLVCCFPDRNPSDRTLLRSNGEVVCMLVRNSSGSTLPAKRAAVWSTGYKGKRISGLTRTDAVECAGIIDEFLVNGVVANDLFWLTLKGPTLTKPPLTGAEWDIDIAEGSMLFAVTQATSSTTNAITGGGRLKPWKGTVAAAESTDGTAFRQAKNIVGRAMSALTTQQTTDASVNLLVYMELPIV